MVMEVDCRGFLKIVKKKCYSIKKFVICIFIYKWRERKIEIDREDIVFVFW